ncbi:hypothetical protein [Planosporangium mesophilum]|uniref:hypothetical protein n=1 Tax=Planosporangium mesophilum TaxID=689768 RepID=UPI001439A1D6|nr:hypothetical protein [Planosporangium mesophilum]NJC86188.1 hypothetical protein [Planosporangium mesophilum]
MTEQQRVWDAWLDAFSLVHEAAPADIDVACPSCGKGKVRITYTGDPERRVGYAIAWCDLCLRGIHLCRVAIHPDVEMLTFGSSDAERRAVVPNVELIAPDPWLGDEAIVVTEEVTE